MNLIVATLTIFISTYFFGSIGLLFSVIVISLAFETLKGLAEYKRSKIGIMATQAEVEPTLAPDIKIKLTSTKMIGVFNNIDIPETIIATNDKVYEFVGISNTKDVKEFARGLCKDEILLSSGLIYKEQGETK